MNKAEIDSCLKRLFPICRSLSGEGNRETLKILNEIVDLEMYEVQSGTNGFDWTVPQEWCIRDAWIKDADSNRIVSFSESDLHAISCSGGLDVRLSFKELKKHLHCHTCLSKAVLYRASYDKDS